MDTTQNTNPMPEKKESNGLWGIVIVVIILIVGGILLLMGNGDDLTTQEGATVDTAETTTSSEDPFAVPIITDTSDDTASIIEDIESLDFSDIDQGL